MNDPNDLLCTCEDYDGIYNEKYDATWCDKCLRWIETSCRRSDCTYCKDRPLYPPIEGNKDLVRR
jgi:hypothetical protein